MNLGPLVIHSDAYLQDWANLASLVRLKLLRSLYSHALLIDKLLYLLIKGSINASIKMKLNISQLTLAKLAQLGRHQSRSQEIPGSIPTGGNIFWWICFALAYVSLYWQNCQFCMIKGKLDYWHFCITSDVNKNSCQPNKF